MIEDVNVLWSVLISADNTISFVYSTTVLYTIPDCVSPGNCNKFFYTLSNHNKQINIIMHQLKN